MFKEAPNFFRIGVVAAGFIIAIFAVLVFSGKIPGLENKSQTTMNRELKIWGVFEESDFMNIFNGYLSSLGQQININYTKVEKENFRTLLSEAVASGNPPDLVIAESDTLLSVSNFLYPINYKYLTEVEYKNTFIDTSHQFALSFGALFYPLAADPLITFYNKTILSQNGITKPIVYWSELANYQEKLTILDFSGKPKQSAFAIGSFDNIDFAKDLLFSQIMQLGHTPVRVTFSLGVNNQLVPNILTDIGISSSDEDRVPDLVKILRFQMAFSDPQMSTFTWFYNGMSDYEAFIREKIPFYFARASKWRDIKQSNSDIDLGLAYLPQFDNVKVAVTSGGLYGVGVIRNVPDIDYVIDIAIRLTDRSFSNFFASYFGMSSARKDVLAGNDGSERAEIIGRSALVMKVFYDTNPKASTNLIKKLYSEILSGRKNIFDAVSDLEREWNKVYR